jgi:hypothetical protein
MLSVSTAANVGILYVFIKSSDKHVQRSNKEKYLTSLFCNEPSTRLETASSLMTGNEIMWCLDRAIIHFRGQCDRQVWSNGGMRISNIKLKKFWKRSAPVVLHRLWIQELDLRPQNEKPVTDYLSWGMVLQRCALYIMGANESSVEGTWYPFSTPK